MHPAAFISLWISANVYQIATEFKGKPRSSGATGIFFLSIAREDSVSTAFFEDAEGGLKKQ